MRSVVMKLQNFWLDKASDEKGSVAVMAVFLIIAGIAAAAFFVDTTRMTGDASRLKQATDAAAQASAVAWARDHDTDVNALADRYVRANLGMDRDQLEDQLRVSAEPMKWGDYDGFRVHASFRAEQSLLGGRGETVEVSSAAVAVYNPVEVALVLPNTAIESDGALAVLRRLGKNFFEDLIENKPDRWMALVPYSQSVNVWDEKNGISRMQLWAKPGALTPLGLRKMFSGTGISSLADMKMPNNQTKRLDVYRGLDLGDNYFWTEPPQGQFQPRWRQDLPVNHPEEPYIQWKGPVIPPLGNGLSGPEDMRYIIGDVGTPKAALLPLTNSRMDFEERLDAMRAGFNVNYAIAMGWGAMALSPAFRGLAGWGDAELPLDFAKDSTTNIKAIVMLARTEGDWFDTDSYNNDIFGNTKDAAETPESGGYNTVTKRFESLCRSFKDKKLLFYFIGVRPGDPKDHGRYIFEQYGYEPLLTCAADRDDVMFVDAATFEEGEDAIQQKLDAIRASIESKSNYVRLVE